VSLALLVLRELHQEKPSVAYVRSSDDIAFCLRTDIDVALTFDLLTPI